MAGAMAVSNGELRTPVLTLGETLKYEWQVVFTPSPQTLEQAELSQENGSDNGKLEYEPAGLK